MKDIKLLCVRVQKNSVSLKASKFQLRMIDN